MTETAIKNYFFSLATSAKYLLHTPDQPACFRVKSRYDPDEFDNAIKNVKKTTVLLVELGSGSLGEDDSPRDIIQIGLHVLIKTDSKFENIETARDNAKETLIKIIACMMHDCKPQFAYSDTAAGPLKAANVRFDGKVKYDDMDGIDGNWYGKCMYFDWRADVDLSRNPNDYA